MNDVLYLKEERDIDKSKIVITDHAVKRFMERFQEVWNSSCVINKSKAKHVKKLLTFHRPPIDFKEARFWLTKLLHTADYNKATDNKTRVHAILTYGRKTFFFRNGRWQFRVALSDDHSHFQLLTVIWLDDQRLFFCNQ